MYERSWMQRFLFDPAQRELLSAVSIATEPRRILDIGCGTGRLLRKARERWPEAELLGVDASEGMIAQARQLTPGVEFHVAMAESLPLPDDSIDLAFSTMSFHHWSNKLQGIREVARVLRSGGQCYLKDVHINPLLATITGLFAPTSGHASVNTLASARQMFAEAGLKVQRQAGSWRRIELVGEKP